MTEGKHRRRLIKLDELTGPQLCCNNFQPYQYAQWITCKNATIHKKYNIRSLLSFSNLNHLSMNTANRMFILLWEADQTVNGWHNCILICIVAGQNWGMGLITKNILFSGHFAMYTYFFSKFCQLVKCLFTQANIHNSNLLYHRYKRSNSNSRQIFAYNIIVSIIGKK